MDPTTSIAFIIQHRAPWDKPKDGEVNPNVPKQQTTTDIRLPARPEFLTLAGDHPPSSTMNDVTEQERDDKLYDYYLQGRDHDQYQRTSHYLDKMPRFFKAELAKRPQEPFELKPHQKEGIGYLFWLFQQKYPGAFLADDPGLGKSLQAIGLIIEAHDHQGMKHDPDLIVVPTLCIDSWYREWSGSIRPDGPKLAVYYNDSAGVRSSSAEEIMQADVILTTYSMMVDDWKQYDSYQKRRSLLASTEEERRLAVKALVEKSTGPDGTITDVESTTTNPDGTNIDLDVHRSRGSWSLFPQKYQIVIFDEAHVCHDADTLLSRVCRTVPAKFRISCTPTRLRNYYADVYGLCALIHLDPFNNKEYFREKWLENVDGEPGVETGENQVVYSHLDNRFALLVTMLNAVSVQRLVHHTFEGRPMIP